MSDWLITKHIMRTSNILTRPRGDVALYPRASGSIRVILLAFGWYDCAFCCCFNPSCCICKICCSFCSWSILCCNCCADCSASLSILSSKSSVSNGLKSARFAGRGVLGVLTAGRGAVCTLAGRVGSRAVRGHAMELRAWHYLVGEVNI